MFVGARVARQAAAGHEAVVISHRPPIGLTHRALRGNWQWHSPRRREVSVASLTSPHVNGARLTAITYIEPAGYLLPSARQTPEARACP